MARLIQNSNRPNGGKSYEKAASVSEAEPYTNLISFSC
jgi:hypothetical protein